VVAAAVPPTEIIITAFLATALAASIISVRTRVPYTVVLVLVGTALAALSISSVTGVDTIYDDLSGGGLFVGLVLPPLLFETMMNVKPDELRPILRPALTLATVGVIVATVVAAALLWVVARVPLYSAFLFAAIISPTDTATVLEVFRRVKVPARLSTMMDTEAVFNDATGLVVFTLILTSYGTTTFDPLSVVLQFLFVFGGGVLIGLGVGFAADRLVRLVRDDISESILTLVAVYGSYSLASSLGVSGLIAVATAGISYAFSSARTERPERQMYIKNFWLVLSFFANTLAFLFIGLGTNLGQLYSYAGSIVIAYLAVMAARLASVYSILGLVKVGRDRASGTWKRTATLGGMRGALSIVLATSLPVTLPQRNLIVTVVLGVAFISITMQGYLLERYARASFPSKPEQSA
jgi:CPA1 family monovalent cation:H+ antiporter